MKMERYAVIMKSEILVSTGSNVLSFKTCTFPDAKNRYYSKHRGLLGKKKYGD